MIHKNNEKELIGRKVYVELEKKSDDTDAEEEDKLQGGSIYKTIEEVLSSASDGDEYIEITIHKQFKAIDSCMHIVEIKDGKVVLPTK